MPYKEKLKNPSKKPRQKMKYGVTNWTEYNQSLKNRGKISLYFPKGDIALQFVNETPYVKGLSGQESTYKAPYVEFIYMMYRLFGWGMRQICGYIEDLWQTHNINIPVPSFGHLSDLFASVPLKIKQFCKTLKKRLDKGETIDLIVDSTGIKFNNAMEWYNQKYGKKNERSVWRKMHIGMDPEFNNHAIEITDCTVSDISELKPLIEQSGPINSVIADGAYYSIEGTQTLSDKGITPVIPPPYHAVVQGLPHTSHHDKIVQYIKDKGTVYAFHKKYNYGIRARVEAQISRIKRCIGDSFQTKKLESQKNEGIVIANIINFWNSLGKCKSVKIG